MKVGIAGASGYTGAELLRLLSAHPQFEVGVATAHSHAGLPVGGHTPSLQAAYPGLLYEDTDPAVFDGLGLVFSALPHGESQKFVPGLRSRVGCIVDLAADFRLKDAALYPQWYGEEHGAPQLLSEAVFGLPELFRDDLHDAIARIDSLIASMPNDPYFYELKGQALLEGGHPMEAIPPLRRAVALAPAPTLIQILLAQALVASQDAKLSDEAIPLLREALIKEPEDGDAYTTLAMAYGRQNDYADADLASAQAAFARGDNRTARELAERAKQRFPIGSPGWVRADDIVAFNKNLKTNPLFGIGN